MESYSPQRFRTEPVRSDRLLTARERDVMRSIGSGETDRQIAARLGVSPRTVHKPLEQVYRKGGVTTRTAAVMRVVGTLIARRR